VTASCPIRAGSQGTSHLAGWGVWANLGGGAARPERNTEAPVADKKTQTETTQGAGDAGQGGKKPNKMEAMRQVLAKLGDGAPTQQIQSELRETFGIEMTTKNIATYRADILKKRQQKKAKKPAAKKPEQAKQEPVTRQESPARQPVSGNGRGSTAIELADVLAVRSLVDRVGAEQLRALIAAFER
jgi:hypothetical protein